MDVVELCILAGISLMPCDIRVKITWANFIHLTYDQVAHPQVEPRNKDAQVVLNSSVLLMDIFSF